jgi:hypothetical protein
MPERGPSPRLEELEGRLVPAVLDLTTVGATGGLAGAIFTQNSTQPAGSGVLDSFVRLQAHSDDAGVAQGYNTIIRPVQFDEKKDPNFTRPLPLSAVPEVTVDGTKYREFLLDINQTNSQPLVSLDELRLYSSSSPGLWGYDASTNQLAGQTAVFDLGANSINLNSGLNPGSGIANMVALIPSSAFTNAASTGYVYLYSKFGVTLPAHGGYEEWAVRGNANLTTPGTPVTNTSGSISGTVFDDVNQDQVLDSGDTDLSGWIVTIADANGQVFATAMTNSNGYYIFNNLATDLGSFSTYTITVTTQLGWTDDTPRPITVPLTNPGQIVTSVNFGELLTGPPGPGGNSLPNT